MTDFIPMYGMVFAKLGIGLLAIILQINVMGKGNLAPTSAQDQLQNYVLGGIIGAIIQNPAISILQFILVLVIKFLKGNFRFFKKILDGHPAILVENGVILTDQCMRFGMQAAELKMKLRAAGVQRAKDVKRAILEQNGQLKVVKFGEENVLLDLITDGQINPFALDLINKDEEWLISEVNKQGYTVKQVYVAEYTDGQVDIYPFEQTSVLKIFKKHKKE